MPIDIYKNPDVLKVIQDGVENGILTICSQVTAQAKALAPVALKNGGRLRSSIIYKTSTGGSGNIDGVPSPTKMQGYVGTPLDYGVYQEFGTRYIAPQPYLRPAIAIKALGQKGADVMKKIIDEKARGKLTKENINQRETFGVGNLK